MSKRESSFISIGDCEVCGNTDMELFHSKEGLACITCKNTIENEKVQDSTAKSFNKGIQQIRNRFEGL